MVIVEFSVGMCWLLQVGIYHSPITCLSVWDNEMCLISLDWKFFTPSPGKKMCLIRPSSEPRSSLIVYIVVKSLEIIRSSKF